MAAPDHGSARSGAPDLPDIEPVPDALLASPRVYIFADHFRQRQLCVLLTRFATLGTASRQQARSVLEFLERDLALHHADEEQDLFPALRLRARPEDALADVFEQLDADHDRSESQARIIREALANPSNQDMIHLGGTARAAMRRYAGGQRRHLAVENGIVLTIARIRLTKADVSAMSRSMKSRRGLDL